MIVFMSDLRSTHEESWQPTGWKNRWAMEHTRETIKLVLSDRKTSRILMCRLRILGALHPAFTKLKSFWLREAIIFYLSNAYQITIIVNTRSNMWK